GIGRFGEGDIGIGIHEAQQDGHVVGRLIYHRQVHLGTVVCFIAGRSKIGSDHGHGTLFGNGGSVGQSERRAEKFRESASAIAFEDGDGVVALVGHGEIGVSVAVEVGAADGAGVLTDRVGRAVGFLKGAVTVSEKDGYIVGSGVGDYQIGRERGDTGLGGEGVAKGGRSDSRRRRLGPGQGERRVGGGHEVSVVLIQQNANGVVVLVGDGGGGEIVVIGISRDQGYRIVADGKGGLRKVGGGGHAKKGR